MSTDADVVDLVAEFLGVRGFSDMSQTVRERARSMQPAAPTRLEQMLAKSGDPSVAHTPMLRETAQKLPTHQPELYMQQYSRFMEWFQGCLQTYKGELAQLCFPFLVHTYFRLLQYQNDVNLAGPFLAQWGQGMELTYPHEMRQVSTITSRHLLQSDSFALQLGASPSVQSQSAHFTVSLCQAAWELLHSFLWSTDSLLLLEILNTHVKVTVEDRPPKTAMQRSSLVYEGQVRDSGALVGQQVNWSTYALPLNKSAGVSVTPPESSVTLGKPVPLQYPDLSGPNSTFNTNLLSRCIRHPPDVSPPGTVPAFTREPAEVLAPAENPSVFMTTLINTGNTLTALKFTKDATQVAGCFSSNTVNVWRLDQLNGDNKPKPTELRFHSGSVVNCDWHLDQKHLLSCTTDGAIRLWDVSKQKALVTYRGHASSPVWDVSFSPFGHYFVGGSLDTTATLWSTDRLQPLRMFVGHYSDVTTTSFHPNSNYVLTGSADRTVRLWDVQSGKCVRLFVGHDSTVSCVGVCPSGRYAASGCEGGEVKVWDLASGSCVATLLGHTAPVYSLDYSATGDVLATGSEDSTVQIWSMDGAFERANSMEQDSCGEVQAKKVFRTKSTPVYSVQWTHRNLLLAGGPFDVSRSTTNGLRTI